ncbi:MAG: FprA family A-type flavoprotein, partial [Lachnospiraceae bacterium]
MIITDNVRYIGVNDHQTDLFEGQYRVPNGMAYNSYVILDEKTAVMDTVDERFAEEWLAHLEAELSGRKPDYLVIQHMEPDHAGSIPAFLEKYPDTKVVATPKAFEFMNQFFGIDLGEKKEPAANGGTLELGTHTLNFLFAPMVHWPEVMFSYETSE